MQLRKRMRLAACVALPLAGIIVAVTISCSRDSEPTLPASSTFRRYAPRPLKARERERLSAAKAQTRWAGDAHHAAMDVVIKSLAKYRAAKRTIPRKGTPEYCAILERAGDVALSILDEHRGISRKQGERRD